MGEYTVRALEPWTRRGGLGSCPPMEEQRGSEERQRRDSLVEPLFGGLEGADEGSAQKESAPESVDGSQGASSRARFLWLLALASLLAWWLLD